jgi:hypothetical protein
MGPHPHHIVHAAVHVRGHVSRYVSWLRGAVLFRRSLTFVPDPNGHDPLPDCKHAAELLLSNPEEFKRRVRRHMQEVPCPLLHVCFLPPFQLSCSFYSTARIFPTLAAPEERGDTDDAPQLYFKASIAMGLSARTALSPRAVWLFAVQLRTMHGRLLRKFDIRNKDYRVG